MQRLQVIEKLSVSPQPTLGDFAKFAREGIVMVVNNRPDGEEPDQPGNASEAQAAAAEGMKYLHLPVTGATLSERDVREFQRAISDSPGHVLAHCKSGTRSLTLWVLGEVLDGRMRADTVEEFGKARGFDLKSATTWLAKHRNGKAL